MEDVENRPAKGIRPVRQTGTVTGWVKREGISVVTVKVATSVVNCNLSHIT